MAQRGETMDSSPELKLPYRLGLASDIPAGKSMTCMLPNGDEVALFNHDGKIFALNNACPHMGGPLAEGEVDNGCVTCPWHGWQFDLSDGHCVNGLGENATAYEVKVENGVIFLVSIHEPA